MNKPWFTIDKQKASDLLGTNLNSGLTTEQAESLLNKYGPNQFKDEKKESFWKEFIEELSEPLILLLILTGIIYFFLGEVSEGITIFVVILLLNTIEVVNEQRAKKAISTLKKLAEPNAHVVRDNQAKVISVETLVPGDLILLNAGDRIPADARVIESFGLALDESSLTGESVPVEKDAEQIDVDDTPLAERSNMLYSGTQVTRGRGKAVVVATGTNTELGRVAGLTRDTISPRTPLQEAMDEVSKTLVWVALGFSIIIPLFGVMFSNQPLESMILTGLALAFATVPEEMPIIITMVLAIGGFRLSKQNAIVKNLKAVETLGAVTLIATDKTGTLTKNQMQVSEIYPNRMKSEILKTALLCSEGYYDKQIVSVDPLERALYQSAVDNGVHEDVNVAKNKQVTLFSFDNARKRMSVVTKNQEVITVWAKGAPESILSVSSHITDGSSVIALNEQRKSQLLKEVAQMAENGLRVIALAQKNMLTIPRDEDEAENKLIFMGLMGMIDPPRDEVKDAIKVMHQAGIRSVMITGDHKLTASAIAEQVGLEGNGNVITGPELDQITDKELEEKIDQVSIFARTTPEHKLRLVKAFMAKNQRVAVTGDGVNDAPALVAADIGVAMGESGNDITREAADIILADDNYTTIANAVKEGRHLFANLRKGVRYYLAIKTALVGTMLLPVLLSIPVPFEPVQIIIMELFMDLAAAAAFVAEPAEGDLMSLPPRDPKEKFLNKKMVSSILVNGLGLFLAVSFAYLLTLNLSTDLHVSQTVAFATWMIGHVFLALNMRSERQPIIQLGIMANRLIVIWGIVALAFVVISTRIPFIEAYLGTTTIDLKYWLIIIASSVIGTFWIEIKKLITYHKN